MKIILGLVILAGGAAVAVSQVSESGHGGHSDHGAHGDHDGGPDHAGYGQVTSGVGLSEPGQGAFAALAEVVRVLEADPMTDWAKVDLAGLRAHLVDMDRLVLNAVATDTHLPDGLSSLATGDAATLAALRRMVPAHAAQLMRDDRWTVAASLTDDGVQLRVTSDDPAVVARIQGLGFFGLMASQDHHRAHHLTMARGQDAHAH